MTENSKSVRRNSRGWGMGFIFLLTLLVDPVAHSKHNTSREKKVHRRTVGNVSGWGREAVLTL